MKINLYLAIQIFLAFNICNAGETSQSFAVLSQTKIRLIAIDPGFGGNESGPIGCDGTVQAKKINLQIAEKISEKVKNELCIDVFLTRDADTSLSPEERTNLVNLANADLLISIHTNGSDSPSASGPETYYLNLAFDPDVLRLAAMKNATDQKSIAELESILTDLLQNSKAQESGLLAKNVQRHLYNQLLNKHQTTKNRGLKQAPFYILLGTKIPSIMVQTGFMTNPKECELLSSEEYQDDIGIGILNGVRSFIKERQHSITYSTGAQQMMKPRP